MNQYRGRLDLYHFDLYRLAYAEDLVDLGFDEYLYGTGVTVVEWGDRFPDLGRGGIRVCLEHGEGRRRSIRFSAENDASRLVIAALQRQWTAKGEHDDRV